MAISEIEFASNLSRVLGREPSRSIGQRVKAVGERLRYNLSEYSAKDTTNPAVMYDTGLTMRQLARIIGTPRPFVPLEDALPNEPSQKTTTPLGEDDRTNQVLTQLQQEAEIQEGRFLDIRGRIINLTPGVPHTLITTRRESKSENLAAR